MPTAGYPSPHAASPGETIAFHLSAEPAGSVTLSFERGGVGPMPDTVTVEVATLEEPPQAHLGYGWPAAHAFVIPADWPSGFYVVRAQGPGDAAAALLCEIVVRAAVPGSTSRTLLLADFVTAQAYHAAGGKSFYDYNSGGAREPKVSFDRPGLPQLGAMGAIIRWMLAQGLSFEVASLVDLHTHPRLLHDYDCIVFGDHAEYWSAPMRLQVERFVSNGGNVMCLSGNTCYRQVRFEDDARTLVSFKNAKDDPEPDAALCTVAFAQPPVHRPPNAMLGVGWTYGGFDGAPGTTPTPYKVHFPTHWAFAGVTLGPGATTIPFIAYETDATNFVLEEGRYPRVTGDEGTPLSTVVLASADVTGWVGKPGLATATLFVRHGMVFAAGTTQWVANINKPQISRITRNLMERFQHRRPFAWEQVVEAIRVTAMAAVGDRVFVSTQSNRLWRRFPVLAAAPWKELGQAPSIVAMAGDRGILFAINATNGLCWRRPDEAEAPWTAIGSGAPGGTRALGASGGMLYAIAQDGRLMCRGAAPVAAPWTHVASMPANPTINALASYHGILLASTSTHRLLRTGFDFVHESRAWSDLGECRACRGLAVVDGMLFMASAQNQLHWLDLRHAALGASSVER